MPPDIVAVAGVPRSGILAATQLAMQRDIHLVTLDELERGASPWREPLRRGLRARDSGTVLVLDDSLHSGGTLRDIRKRLQNRVDVRYGAVYCTERLPDVVDYVFRQVPQPRCFEWNFFHSKHIERACVDLDGVLCEDWTATEDDSIAGMRCYLQHVEQAAPRWRPTYPVLAIVTSRLEKYRAQTTDWLRRHGIRFGELVMSPYLTAAARQRAGDHTCRKADCYRDRPSAVLFVESNRQQAREIARLTNRAVLCTDTMELCHD